MLNQSGKFVSFAIGFALLSIVLAIACKNMVVSLDLFHEMALYRQMATEGVTPTEDAFAYTPTIAPVVHHEWATGALLYLATVSTGWGASGLVAIKYLLTFFVCVGCFVYARRRGASMGAIAILAPIALNVGGWMAFTNIRAQLFTLFFFVIMFFLIELDRKGKKWWVFVWFGMFIVWANMHAGVLAGYGVLGVYGLSRLITEYRESNSIVTTLNRVAHLLAVGLGSAILLNVNPYGWEYTPYLIRAVSMDRPLIGEWISIWETESMTPKAFYLLSVGTAAFGFWHQGKGRLFEGLALLITAYLAMKNYRHGSLYAITWACFVPPMIEATEIGESVEKVWKKYSAQLATAGIAIGIVALGFSINNRFWELRVPGTRRTPTEGVLIYPVGAVEYLEKQGFEGNLFVPFNSGAFVSWKLFPEVKVSIDSRYEVAYPHGAIEENVAFYLAEEGWESTLTKYETDGVLVPNQTLIAQQFKDDYAIFPWKCVYRDDEFSLYLSEELASRFPFVDRTKQRIIGTFP